MDQTFRCYAQQRRQFQGHLPRGAPLAGVIPWEAEIAGVGPNNYPLFINGQQPAAAINNAAPAAEGILFLCLHLAGLGLQATALHHLQPGEPEGESP